jgi:branched-chain amino acid transport system permease protein
MSIITQLLLNGIVSFSYITILAIGFAFIYRVSHFFHFAHGIVFAMGAYFTLLGWLSFGIPFLISIFIAIVMCVLIGCLMELGIYKYLREKSSPSLIFLLASLGIYVLLQNVISTLFGDETKSIRSGIIKEGVNILGGYVTPIQIVSIVIGMLLIFGLSIFLQKTILGKSIKAVSSDPILADISGISSNTIILWTFAIGSGLAGLAGILVALDVDMTPTMGMNALMMAVIAVIIGGIENIPGIALGALLLAMAQQYGAWFFGAQWQDAIAFVILLIFLLFKPEGFFGKKSEKAFV